MTKVRDNHTFVMTCPPSMMLGEKTNAVVWPGAPVIACIGVVITQLNPNPEQIKSQPEGDNQGSIGGQFLCVKIGDPGNNPC
jgi:hypothetical protein